MQQNDRSALILGFFVCLGLGLLGYLAGSSLIRFKEYERTVTVKGLSEREFPADIVIWPIQFTGAGNNLAELYDALERDSGRIVAFLSNNGVAGSEITLSPPAVTDRLAQQYGDGGPSEFRYRAAQTVTVYSGNVDAVRATMSRLSELGKQGIALAGAEYNTQTEYLYTKLNDVKPQMIEEATTKAREVAEKFAQDSNSRLGKIRQASQGQFSIEDRDRNTPYIKKIRVVSTVEYYLSD